MKTAYRWIIGLSLATSVLMLTYVISTGLLEQYAREAFHELLEEQLPPNYGVSYSDINFSWTNKRLAVSELAIRLDTSILHTHRGRYYELHIPKFRIELESLLSIVWENELVIEELSIENPQIEILDFSQTDNPMAVTSESVNVLEFINRYLQVLEVDAFQIRDAAVHYQRPEVATEERFRLEDLDFRLFGFEVDALGQRKNFLNARFVELILNKQVFYLKDGIHRAAFESFRLSTRDSILELTGFDLRPTREDHDAKGVIYEIKIPRLAFAGLDYERSYLQQLIRMDSMVLEQPRISIHESASAPSPNDSSNNALQEILQRVAPKLELGLLRLDRAQVALDLRILKGRTTNFELTRLDIYDWSIDAHQLEFSQEKLPFQRFSLRISDLTELLPDGIHQFQVEQLDLDSEGGRGVLKNVGYQPRLPQPHPYKTKMWHSARVIRLGGVNFWELLFGRPLHIQALEIQSPKSKIRSPLLTSDSSGPELPSLRILQKVFQAPLLARGGIDRVSIRGGDLQLDEQLVISNYQAEVRDLRFSPRLQSWSELSKEFRLQGGPVKFSNNRQTLGIKSWQFDGRQLLLNENKLRIQLPTLTARIQLQRLAASLPPIEQLIRGNLEIDTLRLTDLTVDAKELETEDRTTPSDSSESSLPTIRNFQLDRAHLRWLGLDRTDVQIDSISVAGRYDSIHHIDHLATGGIRVETPQFDHQLSWQSLRKDTNAYSFTIRDLQLKEGSDQLAVIYPTRIPRLRIEQWDMTKWETTGIIQLGAIRLDQPIASLRLHLPLTDTPKRNNTTPAQQKLQELYIDSILIEGMQLGAVLMTNTDTSTLEIPQLNAVVQQVQQRRSGQNWKEYFDELLVQFPRGVSWRQSDFELSVGDLSIQAPSPTLIAEEVAFEMRNEAVFSTLQKLRVKGLELDTILETGRVQAEQIILEGVESTIQLATERSKNTDRPLERISLPFAGGAIAEFLLKKGNVALQGERPMAVKNLNFSARGLQLDSVLRLDRISDYYHQLQFQIGEIQTQFGREDVYSLRQEIHYDSDEEQLQIRDVRLKPRVSRRAYSELLDVQEDVFDIQFDRLTVHHWRWEDAFIRPLRVQRIDLAGLKMNIFRDQHLPHPEKPVPLIQQQIRDIPIPMRLDTLTLAGSILVEMLPPEVTEPGRISFDDLKGTVYNITNVPKWMVQPMVLDASCYAFGDVALEAQGSFDLQSPEEAFKLNGRVGRMDLPQMNEILQPTAKLFIKSGVNREITFEMTANDHIAIGELFFRYKHLKFRILGADHESVGLGNSVLSFWANRLVRSNNPSLFSRKQGLIYYERNKNRAIFNFWSRAFLSGIISSVGVRNNKKRLRRLGVEELEAVDYQEIFEDGFRVRE